MAKSTGIRVLLLLFTASFVPRIAFADVLDQEITQLKKEIERVNAQRKEENSRAHKEQEEFSAYTKRTARKREILLHQTDSMKSEAGRISAENDSLSSRLRSIERRIHEQELQQVYLRNAMIAAVGAIEKKVYRLPPLIAGQYRVPLKYLTNELKTETVECTEALFRLMRIVRDVRTLSQELQVVEGSSPVTALKGTVYRLRIGAVFEAVVNQAGTESYLWCDSGAEDSEQTYRKVEDPEVAAAVLKAIRIREGKTVPELVTLPIASCAEEVTP